MAKNENLLGKTKNAVIIHKNGVVVHYRASKVQVTSDVYGNHTVSVHTVSEESLQLVKATGGKVNFIVYRQHNAVTGCKLFVEKFINELKARYNDLVVVGKVHSLGTEG